MIIRARQRNTQGGLVGATNDPGHPAPGPARKASWLGLQFALLTDELEVIVDSAYYGYESACGQPSVRIPFKELAGFLA